MKKYTRGEMVRTINTSTNPVKITYLLFLWLIEDLKDGRLHYEIEEIAYAVVDTAEAILSALLSVARITILVLSPFTVPASAIILAFCNWREKWKK